MNEFRPRLPINPFDDKHSPWLLNSELLLTDPSPQIVLFLGDPTQADILPLLNSPRLAASLILIATHSPPSLPAIPTGPAVRILRLAQPLAVHDSGALRLVSLLERAQQIAAAHPDSSFPRLLQLAEDGPNGQFTVLEPHAGAEPSSPHVSTAFSSPHCTSPAPSMASETSSSKSFFRSSAASLQAKHQHAKPTKKESITRRPFDAIINCLPSGLAEKALLKHAILVTTLSAPFLTTPHSFSSPLAVRDANKGSSFFRSTPGLEVDQRLPLQPSAVKAHIVHILPASFSLTSTSSREGSAASGSTSGSSLTLHPIPLPAKSPLRKLSIKTKEKQQDPKPKLVQSIEQFLLAFGYPLQSISSSPSVEDKKGKRKTPDVDARPLIRHADTSVEQQRREIPVPFLVATGVLGHVVLLDGTGTKASLGEALLFGALDPVDEGKAWIGSWEEVVVDGDAEAQIMLTPPPPVRTKSTRTKPERRLTPCRQSEKEMVVGLNGLPTPPESAEGGSSRSSKHSSMESGSGGNPSDEEAEVVQSQLARSASGGKKQRDGGVARRRSKTHRRAFGVHLNVQNTLFQGRVPERAASPTNDSLSYPPPLHKRKQTYHLDSEPRDKRNPLAAFLRGHQGLKFWNRSRASEGHWTR